MGLRLVGLAGAIVSFDLNFREKLWRARGDKAHAQETIRRIVEHVDVLVGNEEDLQRGLGMSGPEVARTSGTDPAAFLDMIVRVVQRYPRIRVVATTLREVHSNNRPISPRPSTEATSTCAESLDDPVHRLNDDYLKFLRWAVWKVVEQPGCGFHGFCPPVSRETATLFQRVMATPL
jgi:hypothetical protein